MDAPHERHEQRPRGGRRVVDGLIERREVDVVRALGLVTIGQAHREGDLVDLRPSLVTTSSCRVLVLVDVP